MSTRSKSLSFIELVLVIVVIGLLTTAALPRFIKIIQQAKQAAIETLSGNFATAVISSRAQWEADGRPRTTNDNNVVNYDGSVFKLTASNANQPMLSGYPFALLASATTRVEQLTAQDCVDLIDGLLQNPPAATVLMADVERGDQVFFVTVESHQTNQRCRYYQLASASNNRFGTINVTAGHSFTYIPTQGRVEVNLHQKKD